MLSTVARSLHHIEPQRYCWRGWVRSGAPVWASHSFARLALWLRTHASWCLTQPWLALCQVSKSDGQLTGELLTQAHLWPAAGSHLTATAYVRPTSTLGVQKVHTF